MNLINEQPVILFVVSVICITTAIELNQNSLGGIRN